MARDLLSQAEQLHSNTCAGRRCTPALAKTLARIGALRAARTWKVLDLSRRSPTKEPVADWARATIAADGARLSLRCAPVPLYGGGSEITCELALLDKRAPLATATGIAGTETLQCGAGEGVRRFDKAGAALLRLDGCALPLAPVKN